MIATSRDWRQRKAMREAPPPRGRMPQSPTIGQRIKRKLLTARGGKPNGRQGESAAPVFWQNKQKQEAARSIMRAANRRPAATGSCGAASTTSGSCAGQRFAEELRQIPDNGRRFARRNGRGCGIADGSRCSACRILAERRLITSYHTGGRQLTTGATLFPIARSTSHGRKVAPSVNGVVSLRSAVSPDWKDCPKTG